MELMNITDSAKTHCLRWVGHVQRQEDGRLPKDLYNNLVVSICPTGRTILQVAEVNVSSDEWQSVANIRLAKCMLYDTSEANPADHAELRRLYYSVLDDISGEMETRFSEGNTKLTAGLSVLECNECNFLDQWFPNWGKLPPG